MAFAVEKQVHQTDAFFCIYTYLCPFLLLYSLMFIFVNKLFTPVVFYLFLCVLGEVI